MEDRVVSCFMATIFIYRVEREIDYALIFRKHCKTVNKLKLIHTTANVFIHLLCLRCGYFPIADQVLPCLLFSQIGYFHCRADARFR